LKDLLAFPRNQLDKLKGNCPRQRSMGINEQWRFCFRWMTDGAHDVEITGYH